MKLSVMQENLARGLSVVSRAVSSRSTLPVLANVLLRTEDAGLKLTATNLEIGITYWVPGKIESDGATTVPAKLLTDLVNSLQGGDRIDLELGAGETLDLRCGRFATHLKGIDAEEFPAIQTTGERPTTRIAQNVLQASPRGSRLRRGQRRGATDPDRRPVPVRGRQADARRGRQLPDRRQDDPDPRFGRRDERRDPGSCPDRAHAASCPTPTTRSRSSWPRRATRSCSISTASTW